MAPAGKTHKNPLKNLHTTSTLKFVAKLERKLAKNERISVGTMTLLRPLLSARKPQKCELTIMPIDDMPLRTPLFCVVSERSHSAMGNTKLIPAERTKVCMNMHDMGFTGNNFMRCIKRVGTLKFFIF